MAQLQLVAGHLGIERAIAGLTQERAAVHHAQLAIDGNHAAIELRLCPGQLQLIGQRCLLTQLDQQRWREAPTLGAGAAKTAGILVKSDQAHRRHVAQRQIEITIQTLAIPAAGLNPNRAPRVEIGLLGDDVDHPTRLAAAIERRLRAFQYLDLLDARNIAHAAKAAPIVVAIDEVTRRQIFIPGKTAHGKGIPQSAETILPCDRGIEIERISEAQDIIVR